MPRSDRPAAVLFDMDGLLIDSEPFWRRAETEVFATVGVELTDALCRETMGLRVDEVVRYWYSRHPWAAPSHDTLAEAIVDRVRELVLAEGEALPGADAAIEQAFSLELRLGLASSSPMRLIEAVLLRLGWRERFEVTCSAENEAHGKPHPAVYLRAARLIGTPPESCIAIEDSLSGVHSARAAGMRVVAVPDAEHFDDPRFDVADQKLRSLTELDLSYLRF